MSQRWFTTSVLAAAALFDCLLTAGPAAAGQGWDLFSWSGGHQSNSAPSGYSQSGASYGYPAAYAPVYAPAAPAARARATPPSTTRRRPPTRSPTTAPHPHRPPGRRRGPL